MFGSLATGGLAILLKWNSTLVVLVHKALIDTIALSFQEIPRLTGGRHAIIYCNQCGFSSALGI